MRFRLSFYLPKKSTRPTLDHPRSFLPLVLPVPPLIGAGVIILSAAEVNPSNSEAPGIPVNGDIGEAALIKDKEYFHVMSIPRLVVGGHVGRSHFAKGLQASVLRLLLQLGIL